MNQHRAGWPCNDTIRACLINFFSGALLAFGLYHIHGNSELSEGGVLGLILLLEHWLRISPAASGMVLNCVCYAFGWKTMGRGFLLRSGFAAAGFSLGYWLWEQYPPLLPQIGQYPLAAAVLGAAFVGVGCGFCVRAGGAPCGDDALAMSLSRILKTDIQWAYLITDLTVLGLSLSYIPLGKIIYSLITVILSGQIIGWIQRFSGHKKTTAE